MICVANVAYHIYIKWIFIRTPGVISIISFMSNKDLPSFFMAHSERQLVASCLQSWAPSNHCSRKGEQELKRVSRINMMQSCHLCLFHVLIQGRVQRRHRSTQIWRFHLPLYSACVIYDMIIRSGCFFFTLSSLKEKLEVQEKIPCLKCAFRLIKRLIAPGLCKL